MDVLLWLENLEIVDSVLVQPGHRRQLAERLPAISTRLFSEAKSIGSWRFHLLGHNLHSVSFSSCLPSIQQWLLTTISQWRNYIRKIGTMTARPAGITAGVAWLWLWARWLRSCLPPQLKNLIVTQHQVWKWDLQTDGTLGSFSCSPQPHIALHGWHHREAQKGPTTQAENLSCRKPGFWWSPWGGGWPVLPTWCIYHMFDVSICRTSMVRWIRLSVVCPAQIFVIPTEGFLTPCSWERTKQSPRAQIFLKDTDTWSQQRRSGKFIQV